MMASSKEVHRHIHSGVDVEDAANGGDMVTHGSTDKLNLSQ